MYLSLPSGEGQQLIPLDSKILKKYDNKYYNNLIQGCTLLQWDVLEYAFEDAPWTEKFMQLILDHLSKEEKAGKEIIKFRLQF